MQMEALTGHYLMNGNGPLEVIKSPVAHKHSLALSQSALPVTVAALHTERTVLSGGLRDHVGVFWGQAEEGSMAPVGLSPEGDD